MECMTCDGVYDLRWSALVVIVSADQLTDASFAFCVGEQSDRPWVNPATTERVLQYSERHLPVVIRWSTHSSNYRCSHTLYHPQGDQEELKQRDHLICMLTESTCSLSLSHTHTHTHQDVSIVSNTEGVLLKRIIMWSRFGGEDNVTLQ